MYTLTVYEGYPPTSAIEDGLLYPAEREEDDEDNPPMGNCSGCGRVGTVDEECQACHEQVWRVLTSGPLYLQINVWLWAAACGHNCHRSACAQTAAPRQFVEGNAIIFDDRHVAMINRRFALHVAAAFIHIGREDWRSFGDVQDITVLQEIAQHMADPNQELDWDEVMGDD